LRKASEAFRTISEVADELGVQKHVLRFWESKFAQLKPMKRGGGRRYYRPDDLDLLRGIQHLLHREAYTIRGVQRILKQNGVDFVKSCWREDSGLTVPPASGEDRETAETGTPATRRKRGAAGAKAGAKGRRAASAEEASGVDVAKVVAAAVSQLEEARRLLTADQPRKPAAKRATKPKRATAKRKK
jgi:DNA-binding transcriptional MerR regulator